MKMFLAAATGLALLFGAPATAATPPVGTYILSGVFTGTLSNKPLVIDAVFTGLGDVSTLVTHGSYSTVALSSLKLVTGGTTYTLLGNYNFFSNVSGTSGFANVGGVDILDFAAPELAGYSPATSIGATPSTFNYGSPFQTELGRVLITSGENVVFSLGKTDIGIGVGTGTVPEPAAWALMITGFGLVGISQRSRRKVVTA